MDAKLDKRVCLLLWLSLTCPMGCYNRSAGGNGDDVQSLRGELKDLRNQVAELRENVEALRKSLAKVGVRETDGIDEELRKEIEQIMKEEQSLLSYYKKDAQEKQKYEEAQRRQAQISRLFDEFAVEANLSPEQKEKVRRIEQSERQEIWRALGVLSELGGSERLREARREAARNKERKLREALDEEQLKKYKSWRGYRGLIDIRMQGPSADEDDL